MFDVTRGLVHQDRCEVPHVNIARIGFRTFRNDIFIGYSHVKEAVHHVFADRTPTFDMGKGQMRTIGLRRCIATTPTVAGHNIIGPQPFL